LRRRNQSERAVFMQQCARQLTEPLDEMV